ncbi:MAG: SH3 domain-containing protein [Candidatus Adiutrix sp.]|jgi:hypothetical protein|nr:SH3 domain-containing protein [Candidatus Adiutrix sp.]
MTKLKMLIYALLLPALLACGSAAGAADAVLLQVETKLRATPSALAQPLATLKKGDAVEIIREQGQWLEVKKESRRGWLPRAVLVPLEPQLEGEAAAANPPAVKAGGSLSAAGANPAEVKAGADEIALAGKGFDKSIEAEYRASGAALNYVAVDYMASFVVSAQECEDFLRKGREGVKP